MNEEERQPQAGRFMQKGRYRMLVNVPTSADMDEVALRLYFDAWARCITLLSDFQAAFEIDLTLLDSAHTFTDEWNDYLTHAQPEMGAISVTIQQSAELRLKAIICGTSPFLLLMNGGLSFKTNTQQDIDFSELRTLDAVDLPNAVRKLTQFALPESYIAHYSNMRKLRNQITHLGSHKAALTPRQLIDTLSQQYVSLWPDGRWLYRRVHFDGNSARRFFHDQRYSSAESNVMIELPYTIDLLSNVQFKKMFGISKAQMKGYCPACLSNRASKWDVDGHPTAYRTTSDTAKCAMCEETIGLQITRRGCERCGSKTRAEFDTSDPVCFHCGHDRY